MKRVSQEIKVEKMNDMVLLCKDVIMKTLSDYIPFKERMKMRLVCKEWASEIPKLTQHLYGHTLFGYDDPLPKMTLFQNLRSLSMMEAPGEKDFYESQLSEIASRIRILSFQCGARNWTLEFQSKFTNLVALRLSHLPSKMNIFDALLPSSKTLRILCLEVTSFDNCKALSQLANLEVFSLQEIVNLDSIGNEALVVEFDNALCSLVKMKSLRITGHRTNYAYLHKMPDLLFLDLFSTKPTLNEDVTNVARSFRESVSKMKHLKELALPMWVGSVPEYLPSLLCLFTSKMIDIRNLSKLEYFHCSAVTKRDFQFFTPPKSLKYISLGFDKIRYNPNKEELAEMVHKCYFYSLFPVSSMPLPYPGIFSEFIFNTFIEFSPLEWREFGLSAVCNFRVYERRGLDILSHLDRLNSRIDSDDD